MTEPSVSRTVQEGADAIDPNAELMAIFATAEGRADPYPHYIRIREHAPLFRSAMGSWIVSRFSRLPAGVAQPAVREG